MTKVDAKGRIVLPQEVRERLGIAPGTVVEVREEDGRAVIEPEDEPEEILRRMERMVAEFSATDRKTEPLASDVDPIGEDFRETVREGAAEKLDERR